MSYDAKKHKQMKYNLKLIILFLALSFAGCYSVFAQQLKANATIDSVQAKIGQPVKLTLELIQPKDLIVNFPLFTDTVKANVDVINQSTIDTTIEQSHLLLKQEITIMSFDSGFYYFPGFEFAIDSSNGGGSIVSNPVVLTIHTFEVDTAKAIFDIRAQKEVPYTFRELLPWLIGTIVFFALVLFAIYMIRRIKNKEPIFTVKEKPVDPPHIIALNELDQLKASKLWQTDRVKEFHTKLTDILRNYIEVRFEVPALEQTSEEILNALKRCDINKKSTMDNLKQILHLADMVKFAKMKPLADENDLSLMNAYFIVNQTKQEEVKSLEETREEISKENETTKFKKSN